MFFSNISPPQQTQGNLVNVSVVTHTHAQMALLIFLPRVSCPFLKMFGN